ncbi:MAG TPA: FmdB family zinc ribbon protein [Nitrospiria bacterium]|nr:FmdB family zinc ribbon protein [Nitrospiria bacterium]
MPIYEYECEDCQNRVEVMQKVSDAPLQKCENCGGALRKLLSAPGLMFKGSGWYVTDYSDKLKDPKKAEKEKSKAASKEKPDKEGKAGAAEKKATPEKKKEPSGKKEN